MLATPLICPFRVARLNVAFLPSVRQHEGWTPEHENPRACKANLVHRIWTVASLIKIGIPMAFWQCNRSRSLKSRWFMIVQEICNWGLAFVPSVGVEYSTPLLVHHSQPMGVCFYHFVGLVMDIATELQNSSLNSPRTFLFLVSTNSFPLL